MTYRGQHWPHIEDLATHVEGLAIGATSVRFTCGHIRYLAREAMDDLLRHRGAPVCTVPGCDGTGKTQGPAPVGPERATPARGENLYRSYEEVCAQRTLAWALTEIDRLKNCALAKIERLNQTIVQLGDGNTRISSENLRLSSENMGLRESYALLKGLQQTDLESERFAHRETKADLLASDAKVDELRRDVAPRCKALCRVTQWVQHGTEPGMSFEIAGVYSDGQAIPR